MAVINELGGEKIDVIPFDKKAEKYIANALAPAKIIGVEVQEKNTAIVTVPEDQLSLAIGKEGRNVRLASNLTGWKIDIQVGEGKVEGEEESEESGDSEEKPAVAKAKSSKGKKTKKESPIEESEEVEEPAEEEK